MFLNSLNTSVGLPVLANERGPCMSEAPQQIAFAEPRWAEKEEATSRDARFTSLVERQAGFVYRVAYSVLRNVQDAEDVVQETFLKLYKGRSWAGMVDERAYLARAAWRMAVDRLPKEHVDVSEIEAVSKGKNPEQEAMAVDWNATIHGLIDALPDELRLPLALSTVEEMNSREIGEVMGIPEGTVRTRLMRARQSLRDKLAEMGADRG